MRKTLLVVTAATFAALVCATGCAKKQDSAAVPDAAQGSAVASATVSALPTPPPSASARPPEPPKLGWTEPAGWQRRTPANVTRMTQYTVPHAAADKDDGECVVTTFGGRMMGPNPVEANIERWTRQFDADAGAATVKQTTREVNGMKVTRVEIAGTYRGMMMTGAPSAPKPSYRLLGAVVEAPGSLWFFKLTGPAATVKAATKTFDDMLATIHSGE